ncbi:MAG: tetratricopeptide repeat protein [Gammaproteobacteria bacterium]|nr:tetratricopeptide repeat protein [Gammaproteobacteria bacterium]
MMMKNVLLILALGLLTACSGNMGRGIPAPVETRGQVIRAPAPEPVQPPVVGRVIEPIIGREVRPVEVIPPSEPIRPSTPASPVATLMASVDTAVAAGELEQAAALCERALRISPRDGYVWYRLASIRFQQQRYSDADGFARRALGFAGGDRGLVQAIDSLIARIAVAQRQ